MLKRIFFINIFILLYVNIECYGQNLFCVEKANKLSEYYTKSFQNKDSLNFRILFFNEFPNSFVELDCIYGDIESPLYELSYNHINGLLSVIDNVNDTILLKKIIKTSIGGFWDADGINFFQIFVRKKALQNPDLLCYVLSQMSNAEIRGFFYFLFDNMYQPYYRKIPKVLTQSIKVLDKRVFKLMKSTHKNILKDG